MSAGSITTRSAGPQRGVDAARLGPHHSRRRRPEARERFRAL